MVNVTPDHTACVADLPLLEDHGDPFEPMLVAQALAAGLVIVTADNKIQSRQTEYAVEISWTGI